MTVDLQAIRDRVAAATRGPWRWWTSCSFRRLSSDATGKDGDVLHGTIQRSDNHQDVACSAADMAFIEGARQDVPDLLRVVELQTAALLAVEFVDGSGNRSRCHACKSDSEYWPKKFDGALKVMVAQPRHTPGCPVDTALSAVGLTTQAERDAERERLRKERSK